MAKPPAKTSAKPGDSPLRKAAKKVAAADISPAAASPGKPRAAKAAVSAKPASAAKTGSATRPAKAPKPVKPAAAAKPVATSVSAAPETAAAPPAPVAPTAAPAKPAKPEKPAKAKKSAKPAKGKAKGAGKSALQEASAKIAQLASDILEDRIVPTIDQIKALAASALGHGTKAKKPKRKKK